jgi:hypothetical protein
VGWGVRNYIFGFEGYQAVAACPSSIGDAYYDWSFYFFMTLEGLHYSKFGASVGGAILGRNFDITNGRAACEACSATRDLGTNSAFALGPRKTTENLDRIGSGKNSKSKSHCD